MDATRFELTVSVSDDERLATAVRDLVVSVAQYAGCTDADAATFGRDVEAAVRDSLQSVAAGTLLPVVVRRQAGPVEVLINGNTFSLPV